MNKFKAWLIRKLGGCVYLEQSQKIVFKELPCITTNVDIVLPSPEWDTVISESEKIKIANREAADKIGRYIIENGLYEIVRDHNVEFDCEKIRYKIRVVQPPNPLLPTDEYVRSYDDPESFYKSDNKDLYKDYRQGKDGF